MRSSRSRSDHPKSRVYVGSIENEQVQGGLRAILDPRILFSAAVLLVLLSTPLYVWVSGLLRSEPLNALRLEGEAVPTEGDLHLYLQRRAREWSARPLHVHTGQHVWTPSHQELGATLSADEAQRAVMNVGTSFNPFVSVHEWAQSKFGLGHDLVWRPHIEVARLDQYIERVRRQVDRPPVPGSYDPAGQPIPGLEGETLDVENTKLAIRRALASMANSVEVATLITPPPRSFRRFRPVGRESRADSEVDQSVLMMRQESTFRAGTGRATNIALAARALDGTVVMPGASLSFNEVVGKREARRGFAPALELMNGEVTMGVGGGVCQAAGTLHAAAFFAGLVIDEYRPHSRLNMLAYLRPGLDTMVAWPDHVNDLRDTKDMRVRNPYPFPITVKATVVNDRPLSTLRVELYGAERAFRVDWSFEEIDRVPAEEVVRVDPSLGRGAQRVKQEALPGLIILRRRVIYTPSRRVEEQTRVAYPPTPRIVLVGQG